MDLDEQVAPEHQLGLLSSIVGEASAGPCWQGFTLERNAVCTGSPCSVMLCAGLEDVLPGLKAELTVTLEQAIKYQASCPDTLCAILALTGNLELLKAAWRRDLADFRTCCLAAACG